MNPLEKFAIISIGYAVDAFFAVGEFYYRMRDAFRVLMDRNVKVSR